MPECTALPGLNTSKKTMAVIFDCDGVLFDSKQANINFYNHIRKHFGLPPMAEEQVDYVHMHTADDAIRYIFQGTPYTEAALAYRLQMDYTPFIQDMVMESGLLELLDCLCRETGLAIATNRSNTIGAVLERHGLVDYFDVVISSLDVTRPKPHPECLHLILEHFDIHPQDALYVGDSLVDAQTAASAGVPFVAYRDLSLPADYHAGSMEEVAALVLQERYGLV